VLARQAGEPMLLDQNPRDVDLYFDGDNGTC
jgi:hypothetical protein